MDEVKKAKSVMVGQLNLMLLCADDRYGDLLADGFSYVERDGLELVVRRYDGKTANVTADSPMTMLRDMGRQGLFDD